MRKTTFLVVGGALTLLATQALAQDRDWDRRDHRYEQRDDRYDRRDDRRGYRRDRWSGGGIVLFEHRDFYGDARPIRSDMPDLARIGFNDRVSSMRISRGVWEFCEHAYFQGRCWVYDYDVGVLPNRQNDRFSSVRRVR